MLIFKIVAVTFAIVEVLTFVNLVAARPVPAPTVSASASASYATVIPVIVMDEAQMNFACQHSYGKSWQAILAYPEKGGFGWGCRLRGPIHFDGVWKMNIETLCLDVYGLHAHGGSTAFNWYCSP